MNKFAFTCGDINGIGPEIVIKALNKITSTSKDNFVFICPENVFIKNIKITKPSFEYFITDQIKNSNKRVTVLDIGEYKCNFGTPTVYSGNAAFNAVQISFQLAYNKIVDAIVTAPLSKTAINLAGKHFPGHTEMYAEWSNVKNFVMMFLSKRMNAALATIHEPIINVPNLISLKNLKNKLNVIINSLVKDLGIKNPKIAVLGLNPHAGEEGLIGKEEQRILKPLLNLKEFSNYLSGPFSPDAFFANRLYKNYDLVLGMYHDQVLIPFKLINFGSGVNYTAGLPIIRTSPDHGTAFDIAGKCLANESSFLEAYKYAKKIVINRKKNGRV
jgi:4-hydroxythreonine-4-phosphate dehydrogenase